MHLPMVHCRPEESQTRRRSRLACPPVKRESSPVTQSLHTEQWAACLSPSAQLAKIEILLSCHHDHAPEREAIGCKMRTSSNGSDASS